MAVRQLIRALGLATLVGACVSAGAVSAPAASTSSSVVGARVLESTSLDATTCTSPSATSFGSITVGSSSVTATGAGRCQVGFGSTNSSATLRIRQEDGVGAAMERWSSPVGRLDQDQMYAIEAPTANDVFAAGATSTMRYTHDGGASWSTVNIATGGVTAVWSPDGTIVYASTGNRVYRSANGAATWAMVYDPADTIQDTEGGVGAGGAHVLSVTDTGTIHRFDGTSWTQRASFPTRSFRAIHVVDTNTAVVVGLAGALARSTDGGLSWTDLTGTAGSFAITDNLRVVDGIGATIFARGGDGSNNYRTWASVDGGVNWSLTVGGMGDTDVELDTFGGLWSGGSIGLHRSTDGGATWTPIIADVADNYAAIARTGSTIWVAQAGGTILKGTTSDGGVTWDWSAPLRIGAALQDIDVDQDGSTVVVVGDRGTIERSTDDALSWTYVHADADTVFRHVERVDSTTLVAVGDHGWIVRSTDDGLTWTRQAAGLTTQDLYDVAIGPGGVHWAVGTGGVILRSGDGTSWSSSPQAGIPVVGLYHVEAPADGSVWIAADDDVFRRTASDTTFSLVHDISGNSLRELRAFDANRAVEAWASSAIMWTTNGGGAWAGLVGPVDPLAFDAVDVSRFAVGGGGAFVRRSLDAGGSWETMNGSTVPFRTAMEIDDMNRVFVVAERGYVRRTTTSDTYPDYSGVAPTSWGAPSGATTSLFAGCVQQLVGATAQAPWLDDPDTCGPSDTDPWEDVPVTSETVATLAAAGNATIDFVWGLRTSTHQTAGTYTATVRFEVIAPAT